MSHWEKIWQILLRRQANFPSAIFHLFSAVLAMAALLSNDWIIVENYNQNVTTPDYDVNNIFTHLDNSDKCENIGCRDFWRPARFGAFVDMLGKSHIAFHSNGRVIIDCVTPAVANLFYIIIALCFVIGTTSSLSCSMNIIPPPPGFLNWVRTNSIMEMTNMMLTLCTCVTAIVAQTEVAAQRPDDEVSIGSGVFMVCISGLFNFAAAMGGIRHSTQLNRMRRIDNQRLLCARSLRSWRDAARRPDDTRPIVDFERYLDECAEEMNTVQNTNSTSDV